MYIFFKNIIIIAVFLVGIQSLSNSQTVANPPKKGITGGDENPVFNPDSTIIFEPSKPLVTFQESLAKLNHAWGFNLVFSESGFGYGMFWRKYFSDKFTMEAKFFFSDARNSDEFETPDYRFQRYLVAGKKNRLYNIPFTISANYYPFNDVISESFKPFVQVGGGVSLIGKAPYFIYDEYDEQVVDYKDFFQAIGSTQFQTRFAMHFGIGADVSIIGKQSTQVSLNYYYIPFGEPGLESMHNRITNIPRMTQFGGVQLNLTFGMKY